MMRYMLPCTLPRPSCIKEITLLGDMAPRSWYWSYFVRSKKKFGRNKSCYQAFCIGCVAFYAERLTSVDQEAVANGSHLGTLRSKGEIEKAGK